MKTNAHGINQSNPTESGTADRASGRDTGGSRPGGDSKDRIGQTPRPGRQSPPEHKKTGKRARTDDGRDRTQFSSSEEAARAGRQSGTTERRQVTCPKCGDSFRNLPKHLPACDGEVRADGGREQCLSCGHPYDRDEHDRCPNCQNGSLDEYATDGGHVTDDEFERAVALRKQANPGHEEATEGTLDALENNDHGTPHQTCPFCGAADVRLAEHVPECPEREVRADGGQLTADETLRLSDEGIELPGFLRGYTGTFTIRTGNVDAEYETTAAGLPDTGFYDGIIAVLPEDGDYNPHIPDGHMIITVPGGPERCYEIVDERGGGEVELTNIKTADPDSEGSSYGPDPMADGGHTRSPAGRLREAVKQVTIARKDLRREKGLGSGPPDQDSALAKAEYLLRGVADSLKQGDGDDPDDVDPSVLADGGELCEYCETAIRAAAEGGDD